MGIADIWGQTWVDAPGVDQNFEEILQMQGEGEFTMDQLSSTVFGGARNFAFVLAATLIFSEIDTY